MKLIAAIVVLAAVAVRDVDALADPIIPGTGYGCDLPCGEGQADSKTKVYRMVAKVKEIEIPGSRFDGSFSEEIMSELYPNKDEERRNARFHLRTLEFEDPNTIIDDCFGISGTDELLAPCITMSPGDRVWIRVKNEMRDADRELNLDPVPATYNGFSDDPTDTNASYTLASTEENLPGWDTGENSEGKSYGYNTFNIHAHGMEVEPHLFHPESTTDPTAPWITIEPEGEQQCYCYQFNVASNQATGIFLHHIHRHGSASYQGWSGMVGIINVIPREAEAKNTTYGQLSDLGIKDENIVIYWDSMIREPRPQNGSQDARLALTDWVEMVNGGTRITLSNLGTSQSVNIGVEQDAAIPDLNRGGTTTKYLRPSEPTRLHHVCFNVMKNCWFSVHKIVNGTKSGPAVEMHHYASDGISYGQFRKQSEFMTAPGQRESVVIMISEPGLYGIFQKDLTSIGAPHGPPAAFYGYILVGGEPYDGEVTSSSLMQMTLFEGKETEKIENMAVKMKRVITLAIGFDDSVVPWPQFLINEEAFNVERADQVNGADETWLESWTIVNGVNGQGNGPHPLHIHVQPFLTYGATLGNDVNISESPGSVENQLWIQEQIGVWRDTLVIPKSGKLEILIPFGDSPVPLTGKSVFHCHYLTHEDYGMMQTMILSNDRTQLMSELDYNGFKLPTDSPSTQEDGNIRVSAAAGIAAGSALFMLFVGWSAGRLYKGVKNKGADVTDTGEPQQGVEMTTPSQGGEEEEKAAETSDGNNDSAEPGNVAIATV